MKLIDIDRHHQHQHQDNRSHTHDRGIVHPLTQQTQIPKDHDVLRLDDITFADDHLSLFHIHRSHGTHSLFPRPFHLLRIQDEIGADDACHCTDQQPMFSWRILKYRDALLGRLTNHSDILFIYALGAHEIRNHLPRFGFQLHQTFFREIQAALQGVIWHLDA